MKYLLKTLLGGKKREVTNDNLTSTFLASCYEETKKIGYQFGKSVSNKGAIVCLEGDLGSGKTTFVKGIATAVGINETLITSPTFNYLNIFDRLVHFDLYRLKSYHEFLSMGFDEYFDDQLIVCIEWPHVIKAILPKQLYWIKLNHNLCGRSIIINKLA